MRPAFAIDFATVGRGRLAITHRPRLKSLPEMKSLGATHLVTLLSQREGARTLGTAAEAAGLTWIWVGLASAEPPQEDRDGEFAKVLLDIAAVLHDGGAVVVHCSAGIHRTGMFTYALLRFAGMNGDDARTTLARLRPHTAEGVGEHRLAWGDRLCATMGR
jgi:protein-tyrosine phosphatase